MTPRGRLLVAFAGQRVQIEWHGAAAEAALGMFEDLPVPPSPGDAHVVLRLTTAVADGRPWVTLTRDSDCLYEGTSVAAAADRVLEHTLHHLIDKCDDGVVFHAALAGLDDAGFLLPGPSGSGKSMLAAWLAGRGFVPLADEACFLPNDGWRLEPFLRPFRFKGPWAEAVGLDERLELWRDADVRIVPRRRVAAAEVRPVAPRAIVFPRYEAGRAFTLEPVSSARAAARLFESVTNARNLADYGVGRVTALARLAPAYALSYGHFDQLDPLIDLVREHLEGAPRA